MVPSLKWFVLVVCLLGAGNALAYEKPALEPKPQVISWGVSAGPAGQVTVEYDSVTRSPAATALFNACSANLPHQQIPYEGYLLSVQPNGILLLAKDKHGEIYGKQILAQLRLPDGTYPYVTIADWPRQTWRGLHVLDSGPESLPQIKNLIQNTLVKEHCNVLVYEIDYDFAFKSHPEIAAQSKRPWTLAEVRDLVQTARDNGIKVIPEINCLGHQSWHLPPGALLAAHSDLEETPDGSTPETTLSSKDFYCRSWCPLNPKVNLIMFDLFGELLDAFQTDMFHVGMDEVLVIASEECPRCKGKSPAALYAGQVLAFHQFFTARHVTMLMWADRLLNSQTMGYDKFESSANGTDGALISIPKDIILCDWHYNYSPQYPSLGYLAGKGYRVWPTVYKDLKASEHFMEVGEGLHSPLVMGTLSSVWLTAGEVDRVLNPVLGQSADPNGEKPIVATMVKDLQLMWNSQGL